MRRLRTLVICFFLTLAGFLHPADGQTRTNDDKSTPLVFSGKYSDLTNQQRGFVDDWIRRYNKIAGTNRNAQEFYDAAPISTRSTFEAVTNALQTTILTGPSGEPLGTALDLVFFVETVKGKVPGMRGDQQFRIYVTLVPGAVDKLTKSREFTRKGDNRLFHAGYPTNFRQGGGYPSIQVSVSRDGKRADIDVDYQSSGFPAGLFNGHLAASNSDVRARNNYSRHVNRWSGLTNWWRNLFGLPVEHNAAYVPVAEEGIPANPAITGKAKIQSAVNDFLKSLFIDKQPNLAAACFSPQVLACAAANQPSGESSRGGPVPAEIWDSMTETLVLVGNPKTLGEVIERVELKGSGMESVPEASTASLPFSLVKLSREMAETLSCGDRGISKRGAYYAAAFRVRIRGVDSGTSLLMWTKENGYWKIVSGLNDAELLTENAIPDLRQEPEAASTGTKAFARAERSLLRAQQSFLSTLFLRKDYEDAVAFMAESSFGFGNLYLDQGEAPAHSVAEAKTRMREDLKMLALESLTGHTLDEVIEPYWPERAQLTEVAHPHPQAFLMTEVPTEGPHSFLCASQSKLEGESVDPCQLPGPFYGSFFSIREPGESSAGMGLLWGKVDGSWKIVAFGYDEP